MAKKQRRQKEREVVLPLLARDVAESPEAGTRTSDHVVGLEGTRLMTKDQFIALLRNPLVRKPLPSDFDINREAEHLASLQNKIVQMQQYDFIAFVYAGSSGMVFKVAPRDTRTLLAMKVVRCRLYSVATADPNTLQSLSPVSETELLTLKSVRHPNVVYLHDTIMEGWKVVAVCTSYIDPPTQIDDYLIESLTQPPSKHSGLKSFSPQRLDRACEFLIERCREIASALAHMHNLKGGIYHFDIKPANILIAKTTVPVNSGEAQPTVFHAALTDMGSCIHHDRVNREHQIRVHFTWTYAHPDLTSLVHEPRHITGGLKVSAAIDPNKGLAKYDLYAFGKTIQQLLWVLGREFGERCHASYGFRFLHIISSMLLVVSATYNETYAAAVRT